jgi:hypothetical protein
VARKKKSAARDFKSPIEVLLRNAIVGAVGDDFCLFDYSTSIVPARLTRNPVHVTGPDENDVDECYFANGDGDIYLSLYGNVAIESYRADFLLIDDHEGVLAIECDGHEWHERTKQQASSDRARDRALLALGIPTVRFTGSDIVYNAHACAQEVLLLAKQKHDDGLKRENDVIDSYSRGFEAAREKPALENKVEDVFRENRGIFKGSILELG